MEHPSVTVTEGALREQLASYFLTAPPLAEQSPAQQKLYFSRLRQLGELEEQEVLQNAGAARPLVWGNPVGLLQNLLTAAQRLAAGIGQPLLLFPAREAAIDFETLLHPRLLQLAVAGLLRAACLAEPKKPVRVCLQEQQHCLTLTITAHRPFAKNVSMGVAKESARLQGGSLALCENSIAFSCGRIPTPPADARSYRGPTAQELLQDSLSPVWTCFYSWLMSSPPSSSS